MRSSLPLCSTSFRSFFAALAVLLVWTTVVQSAGEWDGYLCLHSQYSRRDAAIGIERIRVDTIDVGTSVHGQKQYVPAHDDAM